MGKRARQTLFMFHYPLDSVAHTTASHEWADSLIKKYNTEYAACKMTFGWKSFLDGGPKFFGFLMGQ